MCKKGKKGVRHRNGFFSTEEYTQKPFRCLTPFFVLFLPVLCLAQDEAGKDEVSSRLKKVQAQIENQDQTLRNIRKKQTELRSALDYINLEMERLATTQKSLLEKEKVLSAELIEVNRRLEETETQVRQKQENIATRLVAIYKLRRRAGHLAFLLEATSATDLLKRYRYLKIIARSDQAQLTELGTLKDKQQSERQSLEEVREKQKSYVSQLLQVKKEYQGKKLTQEDTLGKLEREEKAAEETLLSLQQTADRLELLLARLMGGRAPERKPAPTREPKPEIAFKGSGLSKLRGLLMVPVDGKVVRRFGKQRHGEFVDMLFIKGLEFQTEPGKSVRVVAPGKVVFSNILPGYGNVIIVDHGERYYTLYGRLASAMARAGQVLRREEVIGVLGEADDKGRNFYFELRVRGKPEDPSPYFKGPL